MRTPVIDSISRLPNKITLLVGSHQLTFSALGHLADQDILNSAWRKYQSPNAGSVVGDLIGEESRQDSHKSDRSKQDQRRRNRKSKASHGARAVHQRT